ncbi:hypothetical protein JVU11DRAFT_10353 [Chiua virens]|nr:hypothetical protein JVU11DRAFT_10353 [Chiua virens]
MAGKSHKRKRSLQDSPVDLSKMRMALNCLESLKEELDGIEETRAEITEIWEHVRVLEAILQGAKKPRMTFSAIKHEDLKNAGIERKRLYFERVKLAELTKDLTTNAAAHAEIVDLHSRIKKIYCTREHGCSRMVLDAVVLALAEIVSTEKSGVAILPEMRITPRDGVQISHPVSGYELWLSGSVDYAIIQYDDLKDYKSRLLLPGGYREDAIEIAKGRLLLVEAKRQGERDLASYIPEAVSQAIALLKTAKLPEVRFCLSDGQTWIFFILKSENGTLTYYDSPPRLLSRESVAASDADLREIVLLVCEWLRPTTTGLFGVE